ncbi:MAG: capsule assembly Wzi family protein, partial [Acidobacteriota bacterium]|nr:capsule assembly Wzi family protein [Acidobacteriota bacterium]
MMLELFGKRCTCSFAALGLWTGLTFVWLVPLAMGAVEIGKCKAGPGPNLPADVYVPMDSWVYPAMDRLRGLGYLDTAFLGIRPWTRRSIQRMIGDPLQVDGMGGNDQTVEILAALKREFGIEDDDPTRLSYACEAVYTSLEGITGLTLSDSFHLGQTIANDYGRPHQPGFNALAGQAGSVEFGRFSLYARGEYQHAPGAAGYSPALVATLSNIDTVPLASNPV